VLPAGSTSADIGNVGRAGSAGQSGGTYTVNGSGADIGGTADAFQFVSQTLSGDGEIRACITSQSNTNSWAKAGVMLRETSDPGSANAMMVLTPGNGFVFEYRATAGGTSATVVGPASNAAPNNWVRLTRSGTLITAYVSGDGNSWTQVGTAVISMASSISAGLAVTSHDNTQTSTATFDNLSVTPFPAPWQTADIGSPNSQGSAEYFNYTYTVKGAGTIGGTADTFRFAYQTLSGDGQIIARIALPQNTGTGARVGVMIRDALTPDSPFAFIGVDGSGNFYWQRRRYYGSGHNTTAAGSGTAPSLWVKVTRSGSTFRGYKSTDGANWTIINSMGITMGTTVYVGLAVSSGDGTTLNTTVFDNVTVGP
jgi:regulation of enolase protein 1 (concanavalin A-like superfamily)